MYEDQGYENLKDFAQELGADIKTLRIDNGTEYTRTISSRSQDRT